ncbi:MAG: hypothetical protein AB1716_10850 [Planctomycetota bacterium]
MRTHLSVVLVAALAGMASAAIIQDDFEGYGSQQDFEAAWPLTGTNAMAWTADNSHSPTHSVFSNGDLARRHYRNFGSAVTPTNEQPLIAEFWMTVPETNNNARQYCEVRGYAGGAYNSGALNELYAIGLYNGITNPGNHFQARVAFGGPNWINLDLAGAPTRTPGWHRFTVEMLGAGVINFYVDGTLSGTVTDTSPTPLDDFILGSGLTSNPTAPQSSYYDDVLVQVVPEPAALALLALGFVLRRR